jgi:hypothetical protein
MSTLQSVRLLINILLTSVKDSLVMQCIITAAKVGIQQEVNSP